MLLSKLLPNTSLDTDLEIISLLQDSRQVSSGSLFFAISGFHQDGHKYLDAAFAAGAVAAVVDEEITPKPNWGPLIKVDCSSAALALAAANWHDMAHRRIKIVGVTGTNGKTTVTYLLESIFVRAGIKAAVIGSTGLRIDGQLQQKTGHTTPGPTVLHQLIKKCVDAGCEYLFLEVSSHAIAQNRIHGLEFAAAVFTNLSHDHLDYHGSMKEYLITKTRLFTSLAPTAPAILNADDECSESIAHETSAQNVIQYGFSRQAQYCAAKPRLTLSGMDFYFFYQGRSHQVAVPLTGMYNIYNTLAAIATANALGININISSSGVAQLPQIPGRFEVYYLPGERVAIIDYAHSPDSLQQLLETVAVQKPNGIITVFGCTGDRDQQKRPMMGAIAAAMSSRTILTSDDPHSEDPAAIIAQIESGIPSGSNYTVEVDRAKAVRLALTESQAREIIVIAGKGDERFQIYADRSVPLQDRQLLEEYLAQEAQKDPEQPK